jgi:phosphopantetheine adenylyltransferase
VIGEGFDYIHLMVLLTASGARGERNNIGVVSHSMVKTTEANKRLKKKTDAKPAGLV